MSEKYGSIKVITVPNTGKWRLEGETDWYDSGYIKNNIPVGGVRIIFKELEGYYKPGTGSYYRISENKTINIVKSYAKLPDDYVENNDTGSIRIITVPNTGKWRLEGETDWYNSGYIKTDIPVGNVRILFDKIPGYLTPSSSSYSIYKNQTSTIAKAYTKDNSVKEEIEEKEEIDPEPIIDPDKKEKEWVKNLYKTIGRGPAIGYKMSDIDEGGFNYWLSIAKRSGMTYPLLLSHFENVIIDYLKNNPNTEYSKYIKANSLKY